MGSENKITSQRVPSHHPLLPNVALYYFRRRLWKFYPEKRLSFLAKENPNAANKSSITQPFVLFLFQEPVSGYVALKTGLLQLKPCGTGDENAFYSWCPKWSGHAQEAKFRELSSLLIVLASIAFLLLNIHLASVEKFPQKMDRLQPVFLPRSRTRSEERSGVRVKTESETGDRHATHTPEAHALRTKISITPALRTLQNKFWGKKKLLSCSLKEGGTVTFGSSWGMAKQATKTWNLFCDIAAKWGLGQTSKFSWDEPNSNLGRSKWS